MSNYIVHTSKDVSLTIVYKQKRSCNENKVNSF